MDILLSIIAATILISLIAFVGIVTLAIKGKLLQKLLLVLVALSAGALMGGAFLHLIPESVEMFQTFNIFAFVLLGFIIFFLIEKVLHWRHCHEGKCPIHTFAYMNLVGDGVHNFVDGLIIAASFVADIHLGIITTIAVALHEIPQELGDFGVLVYGGFKKTRALLMNFATAVTAIFGGIVGFFLTGITQSTVAFLLPFTAGGFIYIAGSDLIPELHKECKINKSLTQLLFLLLGIFIMFIFLFIN